MKILSILSNSRKHTTADLEKKAVVEITANQTVAVAMALHLYMNADSIHDHESNIITIKQLKRSFSPWNSKNFRLLESAYRR
ncbi:MAG: hypothetical protein LBB53_04300 [Prevotellaceae bacterium]|jgi:hypothetical protein|nr:hypothetical protein [Prevotellaceae bacterium]